MTVPLVAVQKISIHAARVGSDVTPICAPTVRYAISIHAARVGSDSEGEFDEVDNNISIHAARVGSDEHRTVQSR